MSDEQMLFPELANARQAPTRGGRTGFDREEGELSDGESTSKQMGVSPVQHQ